jgi:hypothetical protein
MLLLLAGATNNNIKNDENSIKRVLNLQENPENIRKNIDKICNVYPKLVAQNGFLKFKNFKKIHNYLRNADGTPKESPSSALRRIDIDKIIEEYIKKKKFVVTNQDGSKNQELISAIYQRNCRIAKKLLLISNKNTDKVIKAMEWFGGLCDKKNLSWTLETIEKWFPEFLVKGEKTGIEAYIKE